ADGERPPVAGADGGRVRGDQRRDGRLHSPLPARAGAHDRVAGVLRDDGGPAGVRDAGLLVLLPAAPRHGRLAVAHGGWDRLLGARGRVRGRDGPDPGVREPGVPGAPAVPGDHSSAWCLIVFPSTTNTTSSAMFVARSATRSRLRLTRNRSIAAPMMCGSSIMWVRRIRNTERFRASTESSRRQISRPRAASPRTNASRAPESMARA